jgi:hypothetical protein
METKAKPEQTLALRSKDSQSLHNEDEILKLLTKFSYRRGAALNLPMLLTYVDDLSSYSADNVGYALDAIASVPRGEHEPVIPDTATILEAVRGAIRSRRPPVPTSSEKWNAYVEAYKEERMFDGETE